MNYRVAIYTSLCNSSKFHPNVKKTFIYYDVRIFNIVLYFYSDRKICILAVVGNEV